MGVTVIDASRVTPSKEGPMRSLFCHSELRRPQRKPIPRPSCGIACTPMPERQSQPLYLRPSPLNTPRKLVPMASFLAVVESVMELPIVQ